MIGVDAPISSRKLLSDTEDVSRMGEFEGSVTPVVFWNDPSVLVVILAKVEGSAGDWGAMGEFIETSFMLS
jgi:hypothetical protein